MIRLNIIVEEQTEETFVRDLLALHLGERQVFVAVRSVETGRSKHGIHRGGLVSYAKAKRDIKRWMAEDPQAHFSCMFDYYALPDDFPRPATPRGGTGILEWVPRLEAALAADIGDSRFVPYIQAHEFEALLFSNVETTSSVLGATPRSFSSSRRFAVPSRRPSTSTTHGRPLHPSGSSSCSPDTTSPFLAPSR